MTTRVKPYEEDTLERPLYQGLNKLTPAQKYNIGESTYNGYRHTCGDCGELKYDNEYTIEKRTVTSQKQLRCNTCRINSAAPKSEGYFLEDEDIEWQSDANCVGAPDPTMFPTPTEANKKEFQLYCDGCPVKKQCLEFGMKSQSVGVWGGQYFSFKTRGSGQRRKTPFQGKWVGELRTSMAKELRQGYEDGLSTKILAERNGLSDTLTRDLLMEAGTVMRGRGRPSHKSMTQREQERKARIRDRALVT